MRLIILILALFILLSANAEGRNAGRCPITKIEEQRLDQLHMVLKCYVSEDGTEHRGWWVFLKTTHATNGVLVFVPANLPSGPTNVVVYFHGYKDGPATVDKYHLVESALETGLPAITVLPVGLISQAANDWGDVIRAGGLKRLLTDVVKQLFNHAYGEGQLVKSPEIGHIAVIAHSGGSNAAEVSIMRGGVEVDYLGLCDALYGDQIKPLLRGETGFQKWVAANPEHQLRGGHTRGYAKLFARLKGHLPQTEQVAIVPAKTPNHNELVGEMLPGWFKEFGVAWTAPHGQLVATAEK